MVVPFSFNVYEASRRQTALGWSSRAGADFTKCCSWCLPSKALLHASSCQRPGPEFREWNRSPRFPASKSAIDNLSGNAELGEQTTRLRTRDGDWVRRSRVRSQSSSDLGVFADHRSPLRDPQSSRAASARRAPVVCCAARVSTESDLATAESRLVLRFVNPGVTTARTFLAQRCDAVGRYGQ